MFNIILLSRIINNVVATEKILTGSGTYGYLSEYRRSGNGALGCWRDYATGFRTCALSLRASQGVARALVAPRPRKLCLSARQTLREPGTDGFAAIARLAPQASGLHSRHHRLASLGRRAYAGACAPSASQKKRMASKWKPSL